MSSRAWAGGWLLLYSWSMRQTTLFDVLYKTTSEDKLDCNQVIFTFGMWRCTHKNARLHSNACLYMTRHISQYWVLQPEPHAWRNQQTPQRVVWLKRAYLRASLNLVLMLKTAVGHTWCPWIWNSLQPCNLKGTVTWTLGWNQQCIRKTQSRFVGFPLHSVCTCTTNSVLESTVLFSN